MYYFTFRKNNIFQHQQQLNYTNLTGPRLIQVIDPYETHNYTCILETQPYFRLSRNMQKRVIRCQEAIAEMDLILEQYYDKPTEQLYTTFHIPKRTGGLRTINAPIEEFKEALTQVKNLFENKIQALPHNAAYAYIKHRSTTDALQKHQKNNSQWYLKVDIKDFFPNCTPEYIFNTLMQLFPFHFISERYKQLLKRIIVQCCLNNRLPQGTPTSPILTNLIMLPIDHTITTCLKSNLDRHYVYTRYADDILISAETDFDYKKMVEYLNSVLQPQFSIKQEKTRYGSRAGRNWNLGLMVNKDNQITLGHRKKKLLHAMLNNFLYDATQDQYWSKEDTYTLQGQLSYLAYIEPDYHKNLIKKYETKYNLKYKNILKFILNN